MKKINYAIAILFAFLLFSCSEEATGPSVSNEDIEEYKADLLKKIAGSNRQFDYNLETRLKEYSVKNIINNKEFSNMQLDTFLFELYNQYSNNGEKKVEVRISYSAILYNYPGKASESTRYYKEYFKNKYYQYEKGLESFTVFQDRNEWYCLWSMVLIDN